MEPIRFQPHHRAELVRLGLQSETIERLERPVLNWASRYLVREPPNKAVLKVLNRLAAALTSAHGAVEGILDHSIRSPALEAARRYFVSGGRRHDRDGMRLDEASKSLATAIEVVAVAVKKVPTDAARHRSADPYPVELIHKALMHPTKAGPAASAKLRPSVSPTSAFRQIVGICYEAIGAPNTDPERPIRAYMKQWRELEKYAATLTQWTERP